VQRLALMIKGWPRLGMVTKRLGPGDPAAMKAPNSVWPAGTWRRLAGARDDRAVDRVAGAERPAQHGFVFDAADPRHAEIRRLWDLAVLRGEQHADAGEQDDRARETERQENLDGGVLASAHVIDMRWPGAFPNTLCE
jgi:hypothetical protein